MYSLLYIDYPGCGRLSKRIGHHGQLSGDLPSRGLRSDLPLAQLSPARLTSLLLLAGLIGVLAIRISLLEPKLELKQVEVPMRGGDTVKMPWVDFGINVLGIAGDPADLGAKAQRVVQVRVQRQRAR